MSKILDEVMKFIPTEANISETSFEGANIVIYTKNKDFFLNNNGVIKQIVDSIKKRVEVRPDPKLTLDLEEAKEEIKNIIPKDGGEINIIFDPQRSVVEIEAEKPGVVIGRHGEVLREIKEKTLWIPLIKRIPAIKSKIIDNIRQVLYENNDYRKKFLNQVGERIYEGWVKGRKDEWIRLTFLGGGRQVGRSCLLLQTPESKILLDCGVDVAASGEDAYPYLNTPEFKIDELDAVIISHAHMDHVGFLPYLYKYGFKGPCYMTLPSRDIAALLQLDYINIMIKEGKKALYTSSDIKNMVKHSICLDYEEVTDITPDVRLTLYNSGHILGSSLVHLHMGNGLHNLLYTADFNYETSNLLGPAETKFPRLETVIIEGTYGGKDDVSVTREESERQLMEIITNTVKKGGKILMPVLGVGRSQEIMVIVEKAVRQGLIEKIPIYVQGMIWDVNAIHTTYPDFFNDKLRRLIFSKETNPFLSDIFKRIGSRKEMMEVVEGGPCIIIATSGMMVGGASVEYFRHLADNPNNSLVITCYQGEGCLGRRIQRGEKEITFQDGDKQEIVKVNMPIYSLPGFSGHSDKAQLLGFMRKLDPKPKKIIINHGESSNCLELSSMLHKLQRVETVAPRNLETIRIR